MAKKSTAVATRKSNTEIAAGTPDYLKSTEMTGAGVSRDQSDMLVPMGRVLQKLSPEVEKRNTAYIQGAEAGDIYIKNSPNPIIKGADGFLFQPCAFWKGYVEWLPRNKGGGGGSGFVAFHKTEPKDCRSAPDPMNPEREIRVRKNGNVVVETRYHAGFVITDEGAMPLILPFAGSGHGVSKAWQFLMGNKMLGGKPADSFAMYFRFTTDLRTKGANSWHQFIVTDAGPERNGIPTTLWAPTAEDYERGKALYNAFAGGKAQFNAGDMGEETVAGEGDKM